MKNTPGLILLALVLGAQIVSAEVVPTVAIADIPNNHVVQAAKPMTSVEVESLLDYVEKTIFPSYAQYVFKLTHLKKDKTIKSFTFNMSMKKDKSLMMFSWPTTSRHKFLLKAEDNLWMYFSDVRRSIRLSARDSFMGTDANNYDLLQLNLIKDYSVAGYEETVLDGHKALKVKLSAEKNTEGYNKIVAWISLDEKRLLRNDCYSISGDLIKHIFYHDVVKYEEFNVPSRIIIESMVNADRSTLMEITNVEVLTEEKLNDSIFTLGHLETLD